jgi:hypothetical protein
MERSGLCWTSFILAKEKDMCLPYMEGECIHKREESYLFICPCPIKNVLPFHDYFNHMSK